MRVYAESKKKLFLITTRLIQYVNNDGTRLYLGKDEQNTFYLEILL